MLRSASENSILRRFSGTRIHQFKVAFMTLSFQAQIDKILDGGEISREEASALAASASVEDLSRAAEQVTRRRLSRHFDMCSIINAKSGACPENCKWCAQSAHNKTGVKVYEFVGVEPCVEMALANEANGVSRFSIVTSGRKPDAALLESICEAVREIRRRSGIKVCASLGLLDEPALAKLFEAGVTRYHCNLETSPSHFTDLCSTHSIDDKVRTLETARRVGMEICSGGIIGMGETMEQRIEMAFALKALGVASIPINILCPIPGTPLEHTPPLSDDEIVATISLFRLILPTAHLRFAGGRDRLSPDGVKRALRAGINAATVGDLLTTIGSRVAEDKQLFQEAGYTL